MTYPKCHSSAGTAASWWPGIFYRHLGKLPLLSVCCSHWPWLCSQVCAELAAADTFQVVKDTEDRNNSSFICNWNSNRQKIQCVAQMFSRMYGFILGNGFYGVLGSAGLFLGTDCYYKLRNSRCCCSSGSVNGYSLLYNSCRQENSFIFTEKQGTSRS